MAKGIDIARQNGALGSKYARLSLNDVRAANDLIVHYDFDRDGWVVEVPTKLSWLPGEDTFDERTVEVAFIEAWQAVPAEELDR